MGAAASQSRPAELRAGLTHLLVERVYVTAAAAAWAAPEPLPADVRVLDANSQALAEVLGAASHDARAALLTGLRAGDRAQLALAAARAGGEAGAADRARGRLEQTQVELAAVVRQVVPGLPAERVAERLRGDLEAQLAATSEEPYAALRTAAGRAVDTAGLLAGGIALDRRLGPSGTRAATLRTQLTAALTEHVQLVGGLARELADDQRASDQEPDAAGTVGPGGKVTRGRATSSARAALAANARELSAALGSAYPAAAEPLLASWRAHLVRLDAYAVAVAAGRSPSPDGVRTAAPSFARLFAAHIDGLSASRYAADLAPGLDTLLLAVDAAAQGLAEAPAALHRAVADAPPLAALLAAAAAEDLRLG